jgi:hypothetical protein
MFTYGVDAGQIHASNPRIRRFKMGASSNLQFIPKAVKGTPLGASQTLPNGTPYNMYYLVVPKGSGDQGVIGFIAYDIVGAKWAFIQTRSYFLTNGGGVSNDYGQITDFVATLSTPASLGNDEIGQAPSSRQAMAPPISS